MARLVHPVQLHQTETLWGSVMTENKKCNPCVWMERIATAKEGDGLVIPDKCKLCEYVPTMMAKRIMLFNAQRT